MNDIKGWLEDLDLGRYVEAFQANAIDIELLPDLDEADLEKMGVAALGHRKKLLRAIAELGNEPSSTPVAAKTPPSGQAERRQLTVMFCDLVGSTELSRQLDPEDLRDVMRRYQDAVAGAVSRYGGHVAKYLGDGVLAYFGWPQAYEDQAERAVRAGLEAVLAVAGVRMSDEAALAARVGIATGQVVVGDLVGKSGRDAEAVTGETPNLAARLQGVAEPGQVVVGGTTHRLIGQAFELTDLGRHDLKGFDDAVECWGIAGEVATESRFEAAHGTALTRIVGREAELQLLLDRWQLAERGEGQAVLISGEAGIGKSRLMQALREQVANEKHVRIRYQCSPYHANSALYPTIQQLERAAEFAQDDEGVDKLDKLEALLRRAGEDLVADAPLYANLMSLPYEGRYGPLVQPAPQIKERLLEALVTQLLRLAEHRPVLFLFEDAHWIDPTSQELLDRVIWRLQEARVLLIITHRPEWQPTASGHDHITSLQLNRLGRKQGAEIVRAIAGDDIPDDVVERVVTRTDGVPLFIEEVTKSLVESGVELAQADIPATLQASLLARLDRQGPEAKAVAQIGAVVGRTFSYNLLTAVAKETGSELTAALDRLVHSELVFRTGAGLEALYTFKHALVQDTAYDSMLRDLRRDRHARIANILQHRIDLKSGGQPETIAEHFEKAALPSDAAEYWLNAARQAVAKSANVEAIHFTGRCAAQLRQLPDTLEQQQRLLAVLTLELQPSLSVRGYCAPETVALSEQALNLCREVGHPEELFRILYVRWVVLHGASNVPLSHEAAHEYFNLARESDAEEFLMVGHRLMGSSHFMSGDPVQGQEHLKSAIAIFSPDRHGNLALQFGQDVLAAAQSYLAIVEWTLGWPARAMALARQAMARANEMDHAASIIYTSGHANWLWLMMGNSQQFIDETAAHVDYIEDHPNALFGPFADFFLAEARHHNGDESIAGVEATMRSYTTKAHSFMCMAVGRTCLAKTALSQGDFPNAARLVAEAHELIQGGYDVYWSAEVMRMQGECLLAQGGDEAAAEAHFGQAFELSRVKGMKSLELRAAISMGRLWKAHGKTDQAREIVATAYGWFTEGFDTPDLIEGKRLLGEMT